MYIKPFLLQNYSTVTLPPFSTTSFPSHGLPAVFLYNI